MSIEDNTTMIPTLEWWREENREYMFSRAVCERVLGWEPASVVLARGDDDDDNTCALSCRDERRCHGYQDSYMLWVPDYYGNEAWAWAWVCNLNPLSIPDFRTTLSHALGSGDRSLVQALHKRRVEVIITLGGYPDDMWRVSVAKIGLVDNFSFKSVLCARITEGLAVAALHVSNSWLPMSGDESKALRRMEDGLGLNPQEHNV